MTQDSERVAAAAYHEAGHAVATVLAFRRLMPRAVLPVRYIEIAADGSGNCQSANVYSTHWPLDCIKPPYRRPLMESQVIIELAGGISEAIHRCGIRRGREALAFAEVHCGIERDLERAAPVLSDLFRLIGLPVHSVHYADKTLEMLLSHWCAVEALAQALIYERRISGRDVEAIIDRSPFSTIRRTC